MSTRKQDQVVQNCQWQLFKTNQHQMLLCSLLTISRSPSFAQAGFVLPTVAMVSLVVVLLTTSILVRSFERSKHANRVRVNQTVINAATPALDRARAKLATLFADPTLPRETPSDLDLYNALTSNRYQLGDETRLKLVFDINNNGVIQKTPGTTYVLENDETLTTAWRFSVDTDNNGKFDSYTLYSIYLRNPSRDSNGRFNRARNPLEARMPPMSDSAISSHCQHTDTSTSLVGSSWYKKGTKLTKSFFVYTVTVPITNPLSGDTNYEAYKGAKGFSALELQQDRSRIPLINNVAVFQNDLELTPDFSFRLNGNIFTNANLLIGGHNNAAIRLYQVSSKNSCFYQAENSKIFVGGNVGTGNVADTADQTAVTVDLFNGYGNDPGSGTINSEHRSTNSAGGRQVAYNDAAYNQRIALMKQTALSYSTTNPPTQMSVTNVTQYPLEVKQKFAAKINAPGGSSLNADNVLAEQIEIYLKERTRGVPYAEVANPDGTGALGSYTSGNVFTANTIEPPAAWREPIDTNTNIQLLTTKLPQTQPEQQRQDGKETHVGDRIYVGNNLPAFWKNGDQYVTGSEQRQLLDSINWTHPDTQPRYRTTQVAPLSTLR